MENGREVDIIRTSTVFKNLFRLQVDHVMAINIDPAVDNLNVNVLAEYDVVKELVSERAALQASVELLNVVDIPLAQVDGVPTGSEVNVTVKNSNGKVAVYVCS